MEKIIDYAKRNRTVQRNIGTEKKKRKKQLYQRGRESTKIAKEINEEKRRCPCNIILINKNVIEMKFKYYFW
jgi:hypothetical protein